jgi:hypothetical protein
MGAGATSGGRQPQEWWRDLGGRIKARFLASLGMTTNLELEDDEGNGPESLEFEAL